ncbi:MAG: UDP-N-acetylglucosamine 2-epimerase (non-hydrolyzing) [bacterium]|nr:UDP-N-acetylglucosamine 2-epimerase (non-hydrolyzing) [bacterium]
MKIIAIVVGTRPEIIKLAPVIKYCRQIRFPFYLIHTGQHYSENMDAVFFKQMKLPKPDFYLGVGSGTHGQQTGRIMVKIEKILLQKRPFAIMVQGDTNTVLATSLVASKLYIRISHVEAGLRSYDKSMPEEINRVVSDHLSYYLFPPTERAKKNLYKEGINNNVFVTGNTIVEALSENLKYAEKIEASILKNYRLEKNKYILLTLHRQENVDNKNRLKEVLSGINAVKKITGMQILFPAHPRTVKMIKQFGFVKDIETTKIIEPVGYFEFLALEKNARIILTDSGGIQEESCILKIPCVTLRENTERPETLDVGSNILAGWKKENIISSSEKMLNKKDGWENPFGDGTASIKIMEIIKKEAL